LLDEIGRYDAIVGRSATRLPSELPPSAPPASRRARRRRHRQHRRHRGDRAGIAVINAPSGTVSVAELFFDRWSRSFVACLTRSPRCAPVVGIEARWGTELRGRTLGIVGLGRISEVAGRARAFGMPVIAYDPYIAAERFDALSVTRADSLNELLESGSVVTVHTPLTPETRGMIRTPELSLLRDGASSRIWRGAESSTRRSRRGVGAGRLGGAILDVFEHELLASDHRTADDAERHPHTAHRRVDRGGTAKRRRRRARMCETRC
jgi:D-3-phosphoglycerate dehydrogenase